MQPSVILAKRNITPKRTNDKLHWYVVPHVVSKGSDPGVADTLVFRLLLDTIRFIGRNATTPSILISIESLKYCTIIYALVITISSSMYWRSPQSSSSSIPLATPDLVAVEHW